MTRTDRALDPDHLRHCMIGCNIAAAIAAALAVLAAVTGYLMPALTCLIGATAMGINALVFRGLADNARIIAANQRRIDEWQASR